MKRHDHSFRGLWARMREAQRREGAALTRDDVARFVKTLYSAGVESAIAEAGREGRNALLRALGNPKLSQPMTTQEQRRLARQAIVLLSSLAKEDER